MGGLLCALAVGVNFRPLRVFFKWLPACPCAMLSHNVFELCVCVGVLHVKSWDGVRLGIAVCLAFYALFVCL